MMQRVIYTQDQQEIKLEIASPANVASFFVFAIPKSGSVLQDNVMEDICQYLEIPAISIAKTAFKEGIEEGRFGEDICELFVEQGYCYYGFRYFPPYLNNFDIKGFKKILLVRDPRDILVSHYFSMKKSHPLPQGAMGDQLAQLRQKLSEVDIDSYVLENAERFADIFRAYARIEDENLKLFRYEDIIFAKHQWIGEILAFLGLEMEESVITEIAKRHDIFPNRENVDLHIRKVTPGDYKEKLKPDTIEILSELLEDVLIKYRYELT
ncbi:MAG: sulfotransferase domain-containing protein [Elainella sp. C42_A2020_010]|nr:sulfotransferase domain-containing protein [Elainella sp. C42_A2020_010]RNJ68783.1 MAG: hypothetical protein EDM05_14055 [Leptolyngbya sp. IPPAS B-1204]